MDSQVGNRTKPFPENDHFRNGTGNVEKTLILKAGAEMDSKKRGTRNPKTKGVVRKSQRAKIATSRMDRSEKFRCFET